MPSPTMLTFQLVPPEGEPIEISRLPVTLGRKNADILLKHDTVSSLHATFEQKDGRLILRDVGSTNGTFVNGESVSSRPLADGDALRFGEVEFVLRKESVGESTQTMLLERDDHTLISLPRATLLFGETSAPLEQRFTVIGRTEGDVVVSDKALSKRHVEIELLDDGVMIKDLGSSNGTFRENQRVRCERFAFGEVFKAGETEFSVVINAAAGAP